MIKSASTRQDSTSKCFVRDSEESRLHKKAIKRMALAYSRSGFSVSADHIKEFDYPERYRMIRPDIVAEKEGEKVLVEVETRSSIGTRRDKMQRREFGRWAKKGSKRDFRRETVL